MDERARIRGFVVSNFLFGEAGNLGDDTSFLESGIIDSTGILELISYVEESFGIKIEPEDALPENLDSINCVAAFIERKLANTQRQTVA